MTIKTVLGSVAVVAAVSMLAGPVGEMARANVVESAEARATRAKSELANAIGLFEVADNTEAESAIRAVIREHERDQDSGVQDMVSKARLTLGYIAANRRNFADARAAFNEATAKHRGTTLETRGFGTITDQAAYQAIVCLQAEGKHDEAITAYINFVKARPHSPLVYGVHRRLVDLDAVNTKRYDELLQEAVTSREKAMRVRLASCGPKVLAEYLKRMNRPVPDLESLTKACQTDEGGTNMDALREAFAAFGFSVTGREVNRTDFALTPVPFIWLTPDHYVLVLKVGADHARVYDPLTSSEQDFRVPKPDDRQFLATILAR